MPKSQSSFQSFALGEYQVYPELDCVRRDGEEQHLEPRTMDVLQLLARRAGSVVSRDEILETVWNGDAVSEDSVTRCVSDLRRALGDSSQEQRLIQTVPKRGYRIRGECSLGESVREQERMFCASCASTVAAVLQNCGEHLFVFDSEKRYLFCSAEGARALGLDAEDLLGRTSRELGLPEELVEPLESALEAVLANGRTVTREIEYCTIDGAKSYLLRLDPIVRQGRIVGAVELVSQLHRESR